MQSGKHYTENGVNCTEQGGRGTGQACSGHTVRTHFPSTQKTGSGVVPGVSVETGTRTAIYLSSKPCTLTQVLYLGISLPFLPLFYLYLSLSLLKSLSLFPFSFHIFTYTAPTPYSHSYFSWLLRKCFHKLTTLSFSFFIDFF